MSAQDEIGPSGRFRKMPPAQLHALAVEVKGLANVALAYARSGDAEYGIAARKAMEKIQRLVAEDGDA